MHVTSWFINAIGLLATTVGALVIFLHLHRTSNEVEKVKRGEALPADYAALLRDRNLLKITIGLLAAWFVIHYVALILTS